MQLAHGIVMTLLTAGDAIIHSTHDVDKISVVANQQALLAHAADISEWGGDTKGVVVGVGGGMG